MVRIMNVILKADFLTTESECFQPSEMFFVFTLICGRKLTNLVLNYHPPLVLKLRYDQYDWIKLLAVTPRVLFV